MSSSTAGTDNHVVALNGTILAGTMMVKDEGEYDVLRREGNGGAGAGLDGILERVGFAI